MRLLFVIKTMHYGKGGAERVLATLCDGLCAAGHDVTLVSFDKQVDDSFYPFDHRIRWVRLGIGDASRRSTAAETWRRITELRRVLREWRPDAAIGFMHSSCIPLALAALGSGIPTVFSEHIVPQFYRRRRLEYAAFVACGFLAKRFVVISERFLAAYPGILGRRLTAISNPIVSLSDERADVRGGADGKLLLSVGRLDPQKDHDTLLRAFAGLSGRFPDWRLRIIGAGPLQEKLSVLIETLGLAGRVELLPPVEDIAGAYLSAQAYCVPSRFESFGLATAEALSLGLPAIGFADCPGTNELIEHGVNGILVDGTDRVADLAGGLGRVMGDADLRADLGAAGPKILERYSPARFVAEWQRLLDDIAGPTVGR